MHTVVLYTLVGVCMRFNITVNVVTLLLIFYEWHSLNLNEVLSRKKITSKIPVSFFSQRCCTVRWYNLKDMDRNPCVEEKNQQKCSVQVLRSVRILVIKEEAGQKARNTENAR